MKKLTPSIKQRLLDAETLNKELAKVIEEYKKENGDLRIVNSENYTLKKSLASAEHDRDNAISGRGNAEARLSACEAAAEAWRAAFYAVVLKTPVIPLEKPESQYESSPFSATPFGFPGTLGR